MLKLIILETDFVERTGSKMPAETEICRYFHDLEQCADCMVMFQITQASVRQTEIDVSFAFFDTIHKTLCVHTIDSHTGAFLSCCNFSFLMI